MKNAWVDLQLNGQIGIDFSSPSLSADDFMRAAEAVFASGTAVFLPTVITSEMELYRRNLPLIVKTAERAGLLSEIPGLHLEGPFLEPEAGYIGCHNPAWTQPTSPRIFDELMDLASGRIRLLTLAAGPHSSELIAYAAERKVAVSIGHHCATPQTLAAAAEAGARSLTHLGNGVPNFLPRHDNAIFAGLAEDRLSAMFIPDGHHLPDPVLKCYIRCKGAAKLIAVSDGSPAARLPPGEYNVLGNRAVLEISGRLYNPEKQCLVGSASTMSACMKHLASLGLLSDDELDMVGRRNPLALIGEKC